MEAFVKLRSVSEKDYEALKELYLSLSEESLRMRFNVYTLRRGGLQNC